VIVLGLALKEIVGRGGVTDTVAVCDAPPPGPRHVNV
jgi:D-ribose pyranose/furanose isomerase RbsD